MSKYIGRGGKRTGAGREYKSETKVVRVPSAIADEKYHALGELLELIDFYEEDCIAQPSPRNAKFLKFLEEVRVLGF